MLFEDRSLAPYQGNEPYIFLSYSHRDAEAAAEVIRDMNSHGFRLWYDEGLVPGKEWDENIAHAIVECSYFVALISQNYLNSTNCRDELNYARDKTLPLLLIYLEDVELPAGMEMRLGRMLAIHRHKYSRAETFYAKVRSADGISVCRNFDGQEETRAEMEASPLSAASAPAPVVPAKKPLSPLVKFGAPVLVLALLALLLLPRLKKSGTPAVTEAPAPVETALPAAETETPETTWAPAALPQPAELPAATETPAETPAPVPEAEPEPEPEPEPALSAEELAYREAEALYDQGKTAWAALAFHKLGDYRDAQQRSSELWQEAAVKQTVAISIEHSIGLKEDGSVYTAGNGARKKTNLADWGNLVAVAAGYEHSVGLKADGHVMSRGDNQKGEGNVSNWSDVISIDAGDRITLGLKSDGTVLVGGGIKDTGQTDVEGWTDIVAVSAGLQHTIGLKSDGTVIAAGYTSYDRCDVSDWTDIVAVAAGSYHTLGLRADGSVVAVGYNAYGQCNVSDWTDIVAIGAGERHSVGLRADGTVVTAGYGKARGPCDVGDWKNVIEISCGKYTTIGLCSDGTALATGNDEYGTNHCAVQGWKNLRLPSR